MFEIMEDVPTRGHNPEDQHRQADSRSAGQ